MAVKEVLLLGGTGSIGKQTVELVHEQSSSFVIVGLSLDSNIDGLEKELPFLPGLKKVGIRDKKQADIFHKRHPEYEVISGEDINIRLVREGNYSKAVNALVGAEGFLPSLEVLKLNKDLCLANKESLVIGGRAIKKELAEGHGRLFAIDSEHVALAKLLKNADRSEVKRMIITASGGSLRDRQIEDFASVTLKDVLHHPTWQMGVRITVDSSTMVNKGFEFIEASYLYDWDIDNISVLINDESQIHSALEFKDNSYLFEVGPSDMKVPISYALNEGKRMSSGYKEVDFDRKCSLNFRKFEKERYPLFGLVLKTFKLGGTGMAFLNAVDEEAIRHFEKGELTYLQMISFISETVEKKMIMYKEASPENIMKTDLQARELVNRLLF
jgi:1-deoxy-D-xylulose-5-phosphate reductoisomerase